MAAIYAPVLLRVLSYPSCASREIQTIALQRLVSKTEIDKNVGYLKSGRAE